MPIIFTKIPLGPFMGFLWFLLLFFAGITSSVAMALPIISFLKEELGFSQRKAVATVGAVVFFALQFVVFFLGHGFLDEMDYWAGSFGLVLFALAEVIIFAWIFGMDKGWPEITRGAEIKIPRIFYYIIKYVTPVYLLFIMIFWLVQDAIPTFLMRDVAPEDQPYRWGARAMMLVIFVVLHVMIRIAWKRRARRSGLQSEN
jgi:NSS family neurotransmitter:Na+ symporter